MSSEAQAVTSPVAEVPLSRRFGRVWWFALLASGALVLLLGYTLVSVTVLGVGVWGVNIPFVWGFDLINYAWWIGIANGASLFAAILVLRRHDLRTAVNRFAEGVAFFAVICAGIFPIFHLGRPWLFYWTFPYPATFEVWPQFRSTLTWDFWAISTHAIVTSLLWYVGLIPDLATLRDRARRKIGAADLRCLCAGLARFGAPLGLSPARLQARRHPGPAADPDHAEHGGLRVRGDPGA